jgi:fructose-1,6-bisphosphatase/inositol monophosphatase family enzyme
MRSVFEGFAGQVETALLSAQDEMRYYWAAHLACRPGLREGHENTWQHGTTPIDMVFDQIIRRHLNKLPGQLSIISEDASVNETSLADVPSIFLVDALDATHNALAGYPMYSSSVALYQENSWCFGWVYDISRDIAYVAEKGNGSFIKTPLLTSPITAGHGGLISECSLSFLRSKDFAHRAVLADLMWRAKKVRLSSCSSLDLCLIAGGSLDAFVDLNVPGCERSCDIAAAALILKEAGGFIFDAAGLERVIPPPSFASVKDFGSLIAVGSMATAASLQDVLAEACTPIKIDLEKIL